MDMWSIYLGEKLGYYDALAGDGPMGKDELAAATGTDPRYTCEWLEQQAVTGILEVDEPDLPPAERSYTLPAGHAEVLVGRDSLNYLAPLARLVTAGGIQLPALIDAYRTGGGVGWGQYGPDMRTGQADMNRPWFLAALGSDWFPSVPDLDKRLRSGGRVADIGCGEGWSSISIAAAYPKTTVDAFDIDAPSIDAAREHAKENAVDDRVRFHNVDAGGVDLEDTFDVVTAFECIHDLPDPVAVLSTMRRLAKPEGYVVVMDERVSERFAGRGDDIDRIMYGFSLFICLPDGMSHPGSAGTGTVMRPETLRSYARQAGFEDVEILPIENDFWRFYRLTH
ncbi:MAG: class I SAM-dependent methyltransferase [Acidimicrobiia bacterium]|nr:class I SAM-dependent methyltransferase [Acidimicrobiia bacterium]NNF09024.1 class I SAM-dependent methyltransferase [Acidimicrobiia bacterium]NNL70069.1 class I SAM-dependent methyltransferase [Acidimicrobiia bacterium]